MERRYVARGHTAMPASAPLARARGCRVGPVASGLPLRRKRDSVSRRGKCFLRGGLTIPPSPGVRPYDSRHRFGIRGRPWGTRRMGGDGARGASETFSDRGVTALKVGPTRLGPTRPVMLTWPPPYVVQRPTWDRGAAAARRIRPTLSGGLDVTQNAPQRFLPAAAPIRLQRSSHLVAEPIGRWRPDDPSRRRLRQDTPRRAFCPAAKRRREPTGRGCPCASALRTRGVYEMASTFVGRFEFRAFGAFRG